MLYVGKNSYPEGLNRRADPVLPSSPQLSWASGGGPSAQSPRVLILDLPAIPQLPSMTS